MISNSIFPKPILLADWHQAVEQSVQTNLGTLDEGKGLKLRILPDKVVLILPREEKDFEVQTWSFTQLGEPKKDGVELYNREKVQQLLALRTEEELLLALTKPFYDTPPHPAI